MKRYLYLILFAIVLVLPFVLRATVTGEKKAGGEVRGRLVIVTPHNQDIRREFERAFARWHRAKYGYAVALDYRTPGGTTDVKRLLENTYRAYITPQGTFSDKLRADIDLVWGGGDYFFDQELGQVFEHGGRKFGVLQGIEIDPKLLAAAYPEPTLAGVRLYDWDKNAAVQRPKWFGVCLSAFGIVYNPDLYGSLKLQEPRGWVDLTRPELAGWLALADPAHSGSASVAYMMVIQRAMADAEEAYLQRAGPRPTTQPAAWEKGYKSAVGEGWKRGMAQLLLIAANARYFSDSASLVPNDVGNGNAAAGIAIDFYGRVYQASVGEKRCKVVLPKGATAITPDPVAVLAGVKGEQLELSKHFVEFLLSREGQLLWIARPGTPNGPVERGLRRPPVRRDLYGDMSDWTDRVDPFEDAAGFNQRGAWMRLMTDLRGIWQAAWMDGRDELIDAYRDVLKLRGEERDRLIAKLAALPITMEDVEQIRTERGKHKANVEEWKARSRIEWTRRFVEHYREVREEARRHEGTEARRE